MAFISVNLHNPYLALDESPEMSPFQDLRSKNRKAMEALNEMEQKYVKLLKAHN
jgi:hypothetical protein